MKLICESGKAAPDRYAKLLPSTGAECGYNLDRIILLRVGLENTHTRGRSSAVTYRSGKPLKLRNNFLNTYDA